MNAIAKMSIIEERGKNEENQNGVTHHGRISKITGA